VFVELESSERYSLERRSDDKIFGSLKLFNLLNNMLSNRYLQVFLGDQSSRWRRLNNGIPQESVLAPIIFNLHMWGLPSTAAKVLKYADNIVVAYQAKTFDESENNLEADIKVLNQFFHRWCLQPNPGETEMCVFHLNKQLDVMFNGTLIKHVDHPKYLGVTLDRTLTFNYHLEKAVEKVSFRINWVRKLAATKWGSNAQTLRTASLALVYSSAILCTRLAE
jgi:hypothetical protein